MLHLPHNRATLEQAIDLRLALRSALNVGNVSLEAYFERTLVSDLREAEALAVALDDPARLGRGLALSVTPLLLLCLSSHDEGSSPARPSVSSVSVLSANGDVALRAPGVHYSAPRHDCPWAGQLSSGD